MIVFKKQKLVFLERDDSERIQPEGAQTGYVPCLFLNGMDTFKAYLDEKIKLDRYEEIEGSIHVEAKLSNGKAGLKFKVRDIVRAKVKKQ